MRTILSVLVAVFLSVPDLAQDGGRKKSDGDK